MCRAALKETYGSKRGRQLVELVLEDKIRAVLGDHPRRHVMTLNKHPLNILTTTFEDVRS